MSVSSIATLSRAMSSPDLHHPSAWANPALRASDADRERAAEALRRHHLDGRLDTDELQDRLDRCYAARTTGGLAPLLADLPAGAHPPPAPRRSAPWPPAVAVVALLLLAFATAGAIAHGHPGPLPFIAVFLLLRFAWWGPRRHRTVRSSHGCPSRPRRRPARSGEPLHGARRDPVLPRGRR